MTVIKKLRKALNTLEGLEADLESELAMTTAKGDKPIIQASLQEVRDMYNQLSVRISEVEAAEPEYGRDG